MRFIDVVFTKHPKSADAWAHRAWVLRQMLTMAEATVFADRSGLLQTELAACEHAATRHGKNYYAWTHRTRVAALLDTSELLAELAFMHKWVDVNVSDHAGMNHLRNCVSELLKRGAMQPCELTAETDIVCELIHRYPTHEALWYQLRWLFSTSDDGVAMHSARLPAEHLEDTETQQKVSVLRAGTAVWLQQFVSASYAADVQVLPAHLQLAAADLQQRKQ
eukprot:TRINITY_DN2735_c0_g1_i1.p1 TRINITY_DN2735_c0_g1~~TRINITY_DN2735_c0_g1_i1.p1  ORF type:complete len:221 (-),score=49.13 TRINITY_DN2735_c0_g1_i1:5-667(-)